MTIEEFNIKLNLVADGMDKKVNDLQRQLDSMSGKAKTGAKEGAKAQKDYGKEVDKTTDKTKKADKATSGFWKKIKDMALGSFVFNKISQTIQKISDAYKEGLQNVYLFSQANETAFAGIMDDWSSRLAALKNALGAVAATFITAIEPYISSLLEFFLKVINELNMFFARLFKVNTVLANSDVIKQWYENNKETQKTLSLLSGFDTLTIFSNDSTSTNTLPENAFTEFKYDGKGAWEGLKEGFTDLWNNDIKPFFVSVWESLKKWWNGSILYTTEEDENGNSYTRILDKEVGAWENIKKFFTGIWEGIVDWFYGSDPSSGDVGVWQRYIKPTVAGWWETFKNWCTDLFSIFADYLLNAIDHRVTKPFKDWWLGRDSDEEIVITQDEYDQKYGTVTSDGTVWGTITAFFKNFFRNYAPTGTTIVQNATGGVYTRPTVGLVAEYSGANSNPELITPTSLLDERLQANNATLLAATSMQTAQLVEAIKGLNMNVSIGDDIIARSAARGNINYYRLTGQALTR